MNHLNYTSTRNSSISVTAAETIVKGISEEGGLFVPSNLGDLPKLTMDDIKALAEKPYHERAFDVLRGLLGFDDNELRSCVGKAYGFNFRTLGVARLVNLNSPCYMLELWHGPTSAFKDMALQILPGLLGVSMKKVGKTRKTLILVATSGDTGKAALEGFKDVDGIEIAVFYPENGVSDAQKMQMATQEGENVHVFAVKGNFDDCQNAVKAVFTNTEVAAKAEQSGVSFSSANSINWGRLCPQIVYYFSAYADLIGKKEIRAGDKVNICVPTGNFGNILAAYYAMEMGLPVEKLICASNTNNILTDFINTGVYDCNREFHTTVSPSMDILISSNLERLLYHLSGNNDNLVRDWFSSLRQNGKFEVDENVKSKISSLIYAGWCDERETSDTIKAVFYEHGYLMDTHTAVAYKVWRDYNKEVNGDKITKTGTKTIIASTANPYKFGEAVYSALCAESVGYRDEYRSAETENEGDAAENKPGGVARSMIMLAEKTGICVPKPLALMNQKPVRFTEVLEKDGIKDAVLKILSP